MAYMKDSTGKRLDTFPVQDRDRRVPVAGNQLVVWGHSYAYGTGASDLYKRFSSLLAERLGVSERNEAVAGTVLANVSGSSWPKVLQAVTRPNLKAIGGGVTPSNARGFVSPGGLHVCMWGVNDLNALGNTVAALLPVRRDLETVLSRFRATAVFEENHASFTFNGTWTTPGSTTINSGPNYKQTTDPTASYSIALPADFPGGTVAIGITSPTGAGAGAIHTATVGGVQTVLDARNGTAANTTGHVLRIKNIAAGAQTINVTISSLVTNTSVDYWQHEADTATAPVVVLLKQPTISDFSVYGSVAPGPPTNTGVGYLNQVIDEVAAVYDERVVVVDLATLNGDATMFATGNALHPSDKGHQKIADLILTALRSKGFTFSPGANVREPAIRYGTTGTVTNTYSNVGDRIKNTNPTVVGTGAGAYIITEWVCAVEGNPGTWVPVQTLVNLTAGAWSAQLGNDVPGEETLKRPTVTGSTQTTSGRLTLTYFTAKAATVATNVSVSTGGTAAAATPTIARIGLYLVNADDTLTLVASTANDTTLLAATFTTYTKAFTAPYTLTAGQRYAIGIIVVSGAAVPTFAGAGPSVGAMALVAPRVAGYLTGQSDLPASVGATLTGGAAMVYALLN